MFAKEGAYVLGVGNAFTPCISIKDRRDNTARLKNLINI
jgi:hypothetical protein